ncbi:F-box domain containing protein [Tanacetum coccineum]
MEDDMLKAQSKVVDILCNLELIYPRGFFDIMIHLVIHLPLEALEGGPIRPRWMYPFERFMKKLKNYVQNKAKPEVLKSTRTGQVQEICQCHVDKDPGVSASNELFALACGPTPTPTSVNSYVVNGVRFIMDSRDERRTTQNSGICSLGEDEKCIMDDPNIIHVDDSSDLALTTSLNDLEITALHIDGQSIDVDVPPDIINVDEDDDIIDDEDVLPYDLADFDDENLVNVDDDDGVAVVYSSKGTQKPNLGGKKAGRMHTRKETRNLGLRKITDELGPQPIRFEWKDNDTMLPLGDHSSHWANLLGEIVRQFPMHFGSWRNILPERKARVLGKIRTQLRTPVTRLTTWKLSDPDVPRTYLWKIGMRRSGFWSDPKNMARCAQNAQNRAKSMIVCRQRSRSLAALRDKQSSATQEYLSLIQTFFDTHTVGDVFLLDKDRRLYEEMLRLQGLGIYTDDQIMAMVHGGKQRGHIPDLQSQHESGSGTGGDDELGDDEDTDEDKEDVDS